MNIETDETIKYVMVIHLTATQPTNFLSSIFSSSELFSSMANDFGTDDGASNFKLYTVPYRTARNINEYH